MKVRVDSRMGGNVRKLVVLAGIVAVALPLLAEAQGGAGGALGPVGALGQEVQRAPPPTGPAPRLPDGTVDLNGLWAGGGSLFDIAAGLPDGETLPLLPSSIELMKFRAQNPWNDPHL